MDFKTISATHRRDKDFPMRTHILGLRRKLLDGSFYDKLEYQFHEERTGQGLVISQSDRAPNIRSGTSLFHTVVNDAVGLTFGEGRFPLINTADVAARDCFRDLVAETDLVRIMNDAAYRGSVGSVAILMKVLKPTGGKSSRVHFEVFDTEFLTPEYDLNAPDTLIGMKELYKVEGHVLAGRGYSIPKAKLNDLWWFQRTWDQQREVWYQPWTVVRPSDETEEHVPVADPKRGALHNLGVCPWVWIKNLHGGDDLDGMSTFARAADTCIAIDYALSQAGRNLRYSADPLLVINEGDVEVIGDGVTAQEETATNGDNGFQRGGATALVLPEKGKAAFLETTGKANEASITFAQTLRDHALELMAGNRSKPDAINSHQGARALEILNAPLCRLADKLRGSYGDFGLLRLIMLFQHAVRERGSMIEVKGKPVPASVGTINDLGLIWGDWFTPTHEDLKLQAEGLAAAIKAGVLSRETATKIIATDYDIDDIAAERALIEAESKVEQERQVELKTPSPAQTTPSAK